jgi:predicted carbohydrate-binding protein with CBM5 and CBM33 domain
MANQANAGKIQGVATLQEYLNKRKVVKGSIPAINAADNITVTFVGKYAKKVYGDTSGATLETLKGELQETYTVKAYNAEKKANVDTEMIAKSLVSFSFEACASCSEIVWEQDGLNWIDKGTYVLTIVDGKITSAKEVGGTKTKAELEAEHTQLSTLPFGQKTQSVKDRIAEIEKLLS